MTLQEFFQPHIESGRLRLDVSEAEFVKLGKKLGTCGGSNIDYAYDFNIGKDFDLYDHKNPDGSRRVIFEGSWRDVYKALKKTEKHDEQITFW